MMDIDGEGQGSTKRPAPEGTPDREAQARTKAHASEMIPRSLPTELQDPISKVEMSAATIAALRMVVREEITNGMSAMENRITSKMDEQIGKMQQDMEEEKKARVLLETRLQVLEQKENLKSSPGDGKSIAVVGGFGEKTVEEAEELLRELLAHVDGFHEVTMVDSNTVVGLAQFHSPVQAMKFVRSQKKNEPIQKAGLWVSENRSKSERNRSKAVSKLKKFLIELRNFAPKDVIVSYKMFRVVVRLNGTLTPVSGQCARWFDRGMASGRCSISNREGGIHRVHGWDGIGSVGPQTAW